MTSPRHADETWHYIDQHGIFALLNARLTLVVGGADRPHYDALVDQYADAALFAPARDLASSPTSPLTRDNARPVER